MIEYASKAQVKDALEAFTVRPPQETYFQCNMVGVDWLVITATENTYKQLITDWLNGQLRLSSYNKCTDREEVRVYNVRRNVMEYVIEFINKFHAREVLGIDN